MPTWVFAMNFDFEFMNSIHVPHRTFCAHAHNHLANLRDKMNAVVPICFLSALLLKSVEGQGIQIANNMLVLCR